MQKHLIITLTFLISLSGFSQIKFEPGYFINNDGVKTNCLIKNLDWKDNPTRFIYKLTENDANTTLTIDSVQEFGVINESVFKRFIVKIDRSFEEVSKLNTEKEPTFKTDTLFLKP